MDTLLQKYSEAEKTAYLSTIAALASADRSASDTESEFLTALAGSAQLSAAATQQVLAAANDSTNQSIAQHLDALKGSELRYSLVADTISFAKADGKYSPEEQQMMEKMAAYLGVSSEQVEVLGQAVEHAQQQAPVQSLTEANSLFGGDSGSGGGGIGDMLRKVGIEPGTLAQGMLGILAPLLISKVLSGRSGSGMSGGMGGGMMGAMGGGGGMGGGLLGALGGLLGGGGLGGAMGGGQPQGGGGLGSLMGVLGGLGGSGGGRGSYGGLGSGGLGSVLGGLFGR